MSNFKFVIHTGNQYLAGTDSDIFVILIGALGRSGEYLLNDLIKRNAFERDHCDEFTLSTKESYDELGTIYGIIVRSDCSLANSGWLLDTIDIYGKDNLRSTFKISQWITNKKPHTYYDKSLIKVHDNKIRERNIESEAVYHIAANSKMKITDTTEALVGYHLSETKISEITTKTNISTELKASKKVQNDKLNLSEIQNTISFALTTTNRKETDTAIDAATTKTFSQEIVFPKCEVAKKYRPIYVESYEDCKIQVGNLVLDIPNVLSRRGAGYIEVSE